MLKHNLRLCALCLFALAASSALAAEPPAQGRQPDYALVIKAGGDWGGVTENVEKVLHSAAGALWQHFPGRTLNPILVDPKGGPIVLYRRGPNGEYLVRLNTGNRLWAQHAYQFAHEFCHILCNFDGHGHRNKWFEESLCELASLFALRRMAETWKVTPPYPNWREYAASLADYADKRIEPARLPAGTTLAKWLQTNIDSLYAEACDRDKNTVAAVALLPLFERQPNGWAALSYVNHGKPHGVQTFAEFLEDWRKRTPGEHKPFVRSIADEFGIALKPGE